MQPLGSFVEVFARRGRVIPDSRIEKYRISVYRIKVPTKVVRLTDPSNLGNHNITAAAYSSTAAGYHISQEIASLIYRLGFLGIHYHLRHSLELNLDGFALFSTEQENTDMFELLRTQPIGGDIIDSASSIFKLHIEGGIISKK